MLDGSKLLALSPRLWLEAQPKPWTPLFVGHARKVRRPKVDIEDAALGDVTSAQTGLATAATLCAHLM